MSGIISGTDVCKIVENYAENIFILFFLWKIKTLPPIVVPLGMFSVSKARLGLYNYVTSAAENYTSLLYARYEMIGAFNSKKRF